MNTISVIMALLVQIWSGPMLGAEITPSKSGTLGPELSTGELTEQFRLTRVGGMGHLDETVIFSSTRNTGYPTGYPRWIIERVKKEAHACPELGEPRGCPETEKHDWIDTSKCRTAYIMVEGFADFRPHPNEQLISDTPLTTVTWANGGSDSKRPSISEFLGPVVTWWETAAKGLELCWSTVMP